MSDNRGRHAFDPTTARADLEETPQITAGRRELRRGVLVLSLAAAVAVGCVAVVLIGVLPADSPWHPIFIALYGGGTLGFQGGRMIRNGRATLRDELKRQADERPS